MTKFMSEINILFILKMKALSLYLTVVFDNQMHKQRQKFQKYTKDSCLSTACLIYTKPVFNNNSSYTMEMVSCEEKLLQIVMKILRFELTMLINFLLPAMSMT
ncbi:CLUMA_CG003654, isoform A [Clunio marinus]|uniref:CLUMA_CG003654, isoform A n=1 Tax=Clunio marinus TaxID=568069 RepID=A0A1J1HPN3_9DIPT|nr:CLUMA_CG003654, isoform A [Clunio marinus]